MSEYEYPVKLGGHHVVYESIDYEGDKLRCHDLGAYTHTGAWPTFDYCPWCGEKL